MDENVAALQSALYKLVLFLWPPSAAALADDGAPMAAAGELWACWQWLLLALNGTE